MAYRYLRATGDWNGAVWAATSGGAAGSAATPTASDTVYIAANFTVTLTADASCDVFVHLNGRINISSYILSVTSAFNSNGTTARTVDMGSGVIHVTNSVAQYPGHSVFGINGSNATLIGGEGTLILDYMGMEDPGYDASFNTGSKTFNGVIINLHDSNEPLNITGSPTFRSLIIQSKNSAAHTVNFDNTATITTDKFVAIGSSSGSKLTLDGQFDGIDIGTLTINDSSYGQFVEAGIFTNGNAPKYIGSNSEVTYGWEGWLLQDPPKISTLVDPLTTAPGSNTNWTVSGTVTNAATGHDGGGYTLSSGATLTSTDTYDLVGSEIVFERAAGAYALDSIRSVVALGGTSTSKTDAAIFVKGTTANYYENLYQKIYGETSYTNFGYTTSPSTSSKYVKFHLDAVSRQSVFYASDDGITWTYYGLTTLTDDEVLMYRSARVVVSGAQTIGSINPSFSTEVTKDQDGRARISKVVTSSRQSQSRISETINSLQTAISYIVLLFTKSQYSVARVQKVFTSVQDAVSNIRANFVFSRGSYESLPVGDSDLTIPYNSTEVSNVSAEDGVYTNQGGSGFLLHEYKMYHNLDTATITVKWVGKSTIPCGEEPVYLQIYNYDTGVWGTLDSDSISGAGTNLELTGTPSGNNGDYYDPDGFIAVRVYQ